MQNQLNNIEEDIKDIKAAILGNEYGQPGLIHRVDTVEKYQAKDRRQKWTLAGIGIAIAAFFKYGDKIHW